MAADQIIADDMTPRVNPEVLEPEKLSPLSRAKYMLVRGFLWGWARCFSLKGLYLLGRVFGTCEWIVNHNRRRRFRERLSEALGDAVGRMSCSMDLACYRYFVRTRCDKLFYLIFDKLPREKILRRIRMPDRDMIDRLLGQNKGLYVCMSHTGSHHVVIQLMALMGYRVAGVRDRNEGAMRRYVQEKYRESFPELRAVRLFFADAFPRDLYRCFKDGFILGSALDVSRQRGEHLRYVTVISFGREREFLTGTMQIAMRCKAPIIQGFIVSRKNFYFELIALNNLVCSDDNENTLQRVLQQYADNIGRHLLEHPDHFSRV